MVIDAAENPLTKAPDAMGGYGRAKQGPAEVFEYMLAAMIYGAIIGADYRPAVPHRLERDSTSKVCVERQFCGSTSPMVAEVPRARGVWTAGVRRRSAGFARRFPLICTAAWVRACADRDF